MYANSPSIFNVPEITTLRRVKPLPKRRRTSAPTSSPPSSLGAVVVPSLPSPLSAAAAAAAAAVVASTGGLIGDPELEAAANALLARPPQHGPLSSSITGAPSQSGSPRQPSRPSHIPAPAHAITGSRTTNGNGNSNISMINLDTPPPDTINGLANLPPLPPLPGLPPDSCGDTTAEELLAHADTLSARMALQSYYMPMLGSVHEFLAAAAASAGISAGEMFRDRLSVDGVGGGGTGGYVDLDSSVASVDFMYGASSASSAGGGGYHGMSGMNMGMGMGLGMGGSNAIGSGREDDDDGHGDGDYIDHLQQPGNTKKRKVPANASVSQRDEVENGDHTQDEGEERGIPMGRVVECDDSETSSMERYSSGGGGYGYQHPHPYQMSPHASLVPTSYHGSKRGKLTAATLAGLQHKEMLKTRKRQLAAVLGALSHGDTLALDQALSVNYPFEDMKNAESDPPKIRLSKRRVVRTARTARLKEKENQKERKGSKVPMREFSFVCPSATADRLIATKEEVAMLRHRFEEELARQAAKAEQLAAATSAADGKAMSGQELVCLPLASSEQTARVTSTKAKGKKSQRKVTKEQPPAADSPVDPQQTPQTTTAPPAKSRGKKKKRSALANASNPHHLRNYVPSRLPNSGQQNPSAANQQQQTWVSPLPVRFLSAEIPPRREQKGGQPSAQSTTQVPLTNPADEWICAFCEYDLFYGDEMRYRRAVRNRKKILRRRRRARERAAEAASGRAAPASAPANVPPSTAPPAPTPVPAPPVTDAEAVPPEGIGKARAYG